MHSTITVRGHYSGLTFVPDGPLPAVEGTAELIITPKTPERTGSIFDVIGKSPNPRTREDIDAQIREERESWGDR